MTTLSGVTRDNEGVPLGNADVAIIQHNSSATTVVGHTTSDGSGNYSIDVGANPGPFFVLGYNTNSGLIGINGPNFAT